MHRQKKQTKSQICVNQKRQSDDLVEEMLICDTQAAGLSDEGNHVFHIANQKHGADIDQYLPRHVVDQRPFRKLIDERKLVRNQHNLAHQEVADSGHREPGKSDAILLRHQCLGDRNNIEGHDEEYGWRQHVDELVLIVLRTLDITTRNVIAFCVDQPPHEASMLATTQPSARVTPPPSSAATMR